MKERTGNRVFFLLLTALLLIWDPAKTVGAAAGAKLPEDHVFNMRDLGGYQTASGKTIRRGLLYRSGELSYASEADLRRLEKLRIGLVVDLRSSAERNFCPDRRITGARYRNIPVSKKIQSKETAAKRYRKLTALTRGSNSKKPFAKRAKVAKQSYLHNLFFSAYSRKQFRRFFTELLNTKGKKAVLFHCIHGKDRTGAAAALLMMALGASEEDILAEYALSNASVRAAGVRLSDGPYGVKKAHLKKELRKIVTQYGSYERYLIKVIGLRRGELTRLRKYYLK